jgi:hypothetical protein
VVAPVAAAVAPAFRGLAPVVAPVATALTPVVAPVATAVTPVVAPVTSALTPVVAPVTSALVVSVAAAPEPGAPVATASEPVVAPAVTALAPMITALAPTALTALAPLAPAANAFGPMAALPTAVATVLGGSLTLDRALVGFGHGSSAHAALSRYGTGRAAAPTSDAPVQGPTGLPAPHPAAPVDTGTAGSFSGAGLPAAVLGEFLAGLLLGAALCCAGRTRRLTWWFPEVVVGPG